MAQKRAEMIEETRAKLISAARAAFATVGYADSSMDELTAQAGLTRGALYHHFGGKKGLLEAVIAQIDAEISGRLAVIVEEAESTGRLRSGVHWLHQDGRRARSPADRPAGRASGSGRSSQWLCQNVCIVNTRRSLQKLIEEAVIRPVDPGDGPPDKRGAAGRIAVDRQRRRPTRRFRKAVQGFLVLVAGLRRDTSPAQP